MNHRHLQILQYLSLTPEPTTSADLAARFQVSPKTIQNDIKLINKFLKDYQSEILSQRGVGYLLQVEDEALFHRFLQKQEQFLSTTDLTDKEGRIRKIIEKLLFTTEYIKIDDLAEALYCSRSTLQGDIKEIRNILQRYGLILEQKPHYGLKVFGNEMKIRFCLSEFVFNQQNQVLEEPYEWTSDLPKNLFTKIKNIILKNLNKYNIITSDVSLHNLITHVVIAFIRIRNENIVMIQSEDLERIKNKHEFQVTKDIATEIEKTLGLSLPEQEIAYITIHLLGIKLIKPEQEKTVKEIDPQLWKVVQKIVDRIDQQYGFQLKDDEKFLENLCLHLKSAITRYKYKMNMRNPMLEEIKTKYTLAFEAALTGAEILCKTFGIDIDENEIGYIALHIELALERQKKNQGNPLRCVIVCASGLGTAQLLRFKLENEFGNKLKIVGTTQYYNLDKDPLEDIDLIISTVPIYNQELSIPVVLVNTIFGEADLRKIEKILNNEHSNIMQYIKEEYIFLRQNFQTMEEVIRFLGERLLEDGLVDEGYEDSVLEREKVAYTSYGNLMAIPHPVLPCTEETFWSIVTLKKPIQWGERPVQFVLLLNIGKKVKHDLKPMYDVLVRLLDNRNLIQRLVQCETREEFMTAFRQWYTEL